MRKHRAVSSIARWLPPAVAGAALVFATQAHAGDPDTFADGDDLPHEGWVAASGHFSLLQNAVTRSWIDASFGYGLEGGYRFGRWGVFGRAEHNMWVASELDRRVVSGAFNIALGGEVFYLGGYARTRLAVGPSILLTDTLLDEPGRTGIYVDGRPIGLHFPIGEHFAVTFDPIHVAVVAPVIRKIPLATLQYRSDVALEVRW